jgi:hypothetical protein
MLAGLPMLAWDVVSPSNFNQYLLETLIPVNLHAALALSRGSAV